MDDDPPTHNVEGDSIDHRLSGVQARSVVANLSYEVLEHLHEVFSKVADQDGGATFPALKSTNHPDIAIDRTTFKRIAGANPTKVTFAELIPLVFPRCVSKAVKPMLTIIDLPALASKPPTRAVLDDISAAFETLESGGGFVSLPAAREALRRVETLSQFDIAVDAAFSAERLPDVELIDIAGAVRLLFGAHKAALAPSIPAALVIALAEAFAAAANFPVADVANPPQGSDEFEKVTLEPAAVVAAFAPHHQANPAAYSGAVSFKQALAGAFPRVPTALIACYTAPVIPSEVPTAVLSHLVSMMLPHTGTNAADCAFPRFAYLQLPTDAAIVFPPDGHSHAQTTGPEHSRAVQREHDHYFALITTLLPGKEVVMLGDLLRAVYPRMPDKRLSEILRKVRFSDISTSMADDDHTHSPREMNSHTQAAQRAVVTRLSDKDVEGMYREYCRWDKDGDGLTLEQMQSLSGPLSGLSCTQEDFIRVDADGSGRVDFLELLTALFPSITQRHLEGHWRRINSQGKLPPPTAQDLATEAARSTVRWLRVDDFRVVVGDYYRMDADGGGDLDFDEMGGGTRYIADVLVTEHVFREMDAEHLGGVSCFDLLHFLFPLVLPADIRRFLTVHIAPSELARVLALYEQVKSADGGDAGNGMLSLATFEQETQYRALGGFVDWTALEFRSQRHARAQRSSVPAFTLADLLEVLYPSVPPIVIDRICQRQVDQDSVSMLYDAFNDVVAAASAGNDNESGRGKQNFLGAGNAFGADGAPAISRQSYIDLPPSHILKAALLSHHSESTKSLANRQIQRDTLWFTSGVSGPMSPASSPTSAAPPTTTSRADTEGPLTFAQFLTASFPLADDASLAKAIDGAKDESRLVGRGSRGRLQAAVGQTNLQWAAVFGRSQVTALNTKAITGLLQSFLETAAESRGLKKVNVSTKPEVSALAALKTGALATMFVRSLGLEISAIASAKAVTGEAEWQGVFPQGPPALTYEELSTTRLPTLKIDRQAFDKIDTDASGTVNFIELLVAMFPRVPVGSMQRLAREVIAKFFPRTAAANVELNLAAADKTAVYIANDQYKALRSKWAAVDKEGLMGVSLDELRGVSMEVSPGRMLDEAAFRELDKDKSGTVDFKELLAALFPSVDVPDRDRFNIQFMKRETFEAALAIFNQLTTRLGNAKTKDREMTADEFEKSISAVRLTAQHLESSDGKFLGLVVPSFVVDPSGVGTKGLTFGELLADLFPSIPPSLLTNYLDDSITTARATGFIQSLSKVSPNAQIDLPTFLSLPAGSTFCKPALAAVEGESELSLRNRQANFDFNFFTHADDDERTGTLTLLEILSAMFLCVPKDELERVALDAMDSAAAALQKTSKTPSADVDTGDAIVTLTRAGRRRNGVKRMNFETFVGLFADWREADPTKKGGPLTHAQLADLKRSLGGFIVTPEEFASLEPAADGTVTLVNVLRALYPSLNDRVLGAMWQRVVNGKKEPEPDSEAFSTPEGRRQTNYLPNDFYFSLVNEFMGIDVDGSGELDFEELGGGEHAIGGMLITKDLFAEMDKDGSGAIDCYEFIAVMLPRVRDLDLDRLRVQWLERDLFMNVYNSAMMIGGSVVPAKEAVSCAKHRHPDRPTVVVANPLLWATSYRVGGYYIDPVSLNELSGGTAAKKDYTKKPEPTLFMLRDILCTVFPAVPQICATRHCQLTIPVAEAQMLHKAFSALSDLPTRNSEGPCVSRATWLNAPAAKVSALKPQLFAYENETKTAFGKRVANYEMEHFQRSAQKGAMSFYNYLRSFYYLIPDNKLRKVAADPTVDHFPVLGENELEADTAADINRECDNASAAIEKAEALAWKDLMADERNARKVVLRKEKEAERLKKLDRLVADEVTVRAGIMEVEADAFATLRNLELSSRETLMRAEAVRADSAAELERLLKLLASEEAQRRATLQQMFEDGVAALVAAEREERLAARAVVVAVPTRDLDAEAAAAARAVEQMMRIMALLSDEQDARRVIVTQSTDEYEDLLRAHAKEWADLMRAPSPPPAPVVPPIPHAPPPPIPRKAQTFACRFCSEVFTSAWRAEVHEVRCPIGFHVLSEGLNAPNLHISSLPSGGMDQSTASSRPVTLAEVARSVPQVYPVAHQDDYSSLLPSPHKGGSATRSPAYPSAAPLERPAHLITALSPDLGLPSLSPMRPDSARWSRPATSARPDTGASYVSTLRGGSGVIRGVATPMDVWDSFASLPSPARTVPRPGSSVGWLGSPLHRDPQDMLRMHQSLDSHSRPTTSNGYGMPLHGMSRPTTSSLPMIRGIEGMGSLLQRVAEVGDTSPARLAGLHATASRMSPPRPPTFGDNYDAM